MLRSSGLPIAAVLMVMAGFDATAAQIGQPAPADIQAVEDCLNHARAAGAAPESCIGTVATACHASSPAAQAKMKCMERENEVWNTQNVSDFARLWSLANSEAAHQALREAQTAYERAKLGLCAFERIARGNTPDALLAASKCRLDATAHQALWLRRQIDVLMKK